MRNDSTRTPSSKAKTVARRAQRLHKHNTGSALHGSPFRTAQTFSVSQICRIFRVSPAQIGIIEGAR